MKEEKLQDTPVTEHSGKTYIDHESAQVFIAELISKAEEQSSGLIEEESDSIKRDRSILFQD